MESIVIYDEFDPHFEDVEIRLIPIEEIKKEIIAEYAKKEIEKIIFDSIG